MNKFKNSVVYQIYIKSFMDSNGDGVGDLKGIIEKLDYLQEIGTDYIWITPFFESPLNDNGYDISDYKSVASIFGTMEDVDILIREAKKHKIGVMLDMVFNHTSTEHIWFKKALSGDKKYMDYYIFKDGKDKNPPTNWISKFGGNAWEYVESLDKWYLHLFDVTQADLNWDNEEVRSELKEIILFWKNKGVEGFRFDVVNLVSKPDVFENDYEGDGRRFYTDGIRVHEYIKELVKDTGIEDMVTVGEMSSTSLENCIKYSNKDEKELSMVFNFHHLKIDYNNGDKWEIKKPDYAKLKELLEYWQIGMQKGKGWNALFWCNHDQPRAVSRFGDDKKYLKESAKMLATMMYMLQGTPYIYQGEEIGMTNHYYKSIEEYKDVESINYYNIMLQNKKTKEEALETLSLRSRDNGRTPMQWSNEKEAGFTKGKPWIKIPKTYEYINVEKEKKEEDSILSYYKDLIKLRKKYNIIANGDIIFSHKEYEELFVYERNIENEKMIVINNITNKKVTLNEKIDVSKYECLISNYKVQSEETLYELRPYESIVYFKKIK